MLLLLTCLNRYCSIINVKSYKSRDQKSNSSVPSISKDVLKDNNCQQNWNWFLFVYISGGSWRTVFSDFAFYFLSFWISDLSRNLTPAGTLLPTILGYLLHHNSCHVPTPGHFLTLQFKQCLMGYKVNCFNEFIR